MFAFPYRRSRRATPASKAESVLNHRPHTTRTLFKLTLHLPTRVLGLLAVAFALSGVASAQGTGTITGVVVDAATGETLPIASVVVSETDRKSVV